MIGLLICHLEQGQPLTYLEESEDGIQLLCNLRGVSSLIPPEIICHILKPSKCANTDRMLLLVTSFQKIMLMMRSLLLNAHNC